MPLQMSCVEKLVESMRLALGKEVYTYEQESMQKQPEEKMLRLSKTCFFFLSVVCRFGTSAKWVRISPLQLTRVLNFDCQQEDVARRSTYIPIFMELNHQ